MSRISQVFSVEFLHIHLQLWLFTKQPGLTKNAIMIRNVRESLSHNFESRECYEKLDIVNDPSCYLIIGPSC